jgi:hypothetical protein
VSSQRRVGYGIVTGGSPEELAMKVQTMLAQGFRPAGGVSSTGQVGVVGPGGFMLFQAMFFEQEIPEEQGEGSSSSPEKKILEA